MFLKINNHESNSLACWGVGYCSADELKYAEYPCYIINHSEAGSINSLISKSAYCSVFNISHSPETPSKLKLLKWQKKWDNRWLGNVSESTSIDIGVVSVNVNILKLDKINVLELFDMLGDVTTSFAIFHKDKGMDGVLRALRESIIIKEFSSVDYPKLLSGLSCNECFIVRKRNYPEESLILISL